MADTVRDPAAQSNPPDPQVPSSDESITVPSPASTVVTNPPDPQVPAAPAPTPVPSRADTVTGNPPDPQVPPGPSLPPLPLGSAGTFNGVDPYQDGRRLDIVTVPRGQPGPLTRDPVTGSLRIDIEDVGDVPSNDVVTTAPPVDQPDQVLLPRVRASSPPVVSDTGGVPTQSLDTLFEDPGFVPQSTPAFIPPGFSPYGEQDDFLDPDLLRQPGQDDFQDELDNLIRAQERETQEAILARRRAELSDTGAQLPPPVPPDDPQAYPNGLPVDDEGNVNPGWELNEQTGEYIYVGDLRPGQIYVSPGTAASAAASRQQATLDRARQQATIQSQRKQDNDTDWRFRISLAPGAQYLYRAPDIGGQPSSGILAPLARTNGVIFPYTPAITTVYEAQYNDYQLTHSNYRGYFYQGSRVGDVQIDAMFTAQDTAEAEYLLAVIHFFRSITKMFYGQDPERGTPPPLVYASGFGEYQFNRHPCVVSQFNYRLPNDVDYIRARSKNTVPTNLLQRRQRESLPTNVFTSAWKRLSSAGLTKGAQPAPPPVPSLGVADATYVPTKMEITVMLKPIQSREQQSRQFSLKQYANGDLLKGGFW